MFKLNICVNSKNRKSDEIFSLDIIIIMNHLYIYILIIGSIFNLGIEQWSVRGCGIMHGERF
jgi:hypothetical protein